MKIFRGGLSVCLLVMAFSTFGHASEDNANVQFEPIFGVGYAASSANSGMGYHAGARILSNANPTKRWGGEITYISPFGFKDSLSHKNYIAVGIVLQQVFQEQFVASIGTLGYVGIDENKNNPFGLLTEIGWEPKITDNVQLFVALRFEWVFEVSTIRSSSLSLGFKF